MIASGIGLAALAFTSEKVISEIPPQANQSPPLDNSSADDQRDLKFASKVTSNDIDNFQLPLSKVVDDELAIERVLTSPGGFEFPYPDGPNDMGNTP